MFIGHFGLAFAAKKADGRASLGTYVMAAQWPDLVWPVFLLLGWEEVRIAPGDTAVTPLRFVSYPWSHSLLLDLAWGAALAALYWARRREARAALGIAALVVSHWVLDLITHRPDMPLWPGSDRKLGLSLWNSVPATVVAEYLVFGAGLILYFRATRAADRIGRYATLALAAFLAGLYVLVVTGPPPPNVTAIAVSGLFGWLLVLWAAWADRHRRPAQP